MGSQGGKTVCSEQVTKVELKIGEKEKNVILLKDTSSQQNEKFVLTHIFDHTQNLLNQSLIEKEEKLKICDPLADLLSNFYNIALISIKNENDEPFVFIFSFFFSFRIH